MRMAKMLGMAVLVPGLATAGLGDFWTDLFQKSRDAGYRDANDRLDWSIRLARDAVTYGDFESARQALFWSATADNDAKVTGRTAQLDQERQAISQAQANAAIRAAWERKQHACDESGGAWGDDGTCDMTEVLEARRAAAEIQRSEACRATGGVWQNGNCNSPKQADPNLALLTNAFMPHTIFGKKKRGGLMGYSGMSDSVPGLGANPTNVMAAAPPISVITVDPSTGRPTTKSAGMTLATGALAGAAAGATLGSVVPGYGTVIGGAIGAIAGSVPGIMAMVQAKQGGNTKQERSNKFAQALQQAAQLNIPAAVAAIGAANAEIQRFQVLAERSAYFASGPVVEAVTFAVAPNQELSTAGNALVGVVNTYSEGQNTINPHVLTNPALLALQAIPADVAATNAALGPAQMANSNLERALVQGGG